MTAANSSIVFLVSLADLLKFAKYLVGKKAEKVWESVPNAEKVQESVLKAKKVQVSVPKAKKVWESVLKAEKV